MRKQEDTKTPAISYAKVVSGGNNAQEGLKRIEVLDELIGNNPGFNNEHFLMVVNDKAVKQSKRKNFQ